MIAQMAKIQIAMPRCEEEKLLTWLQEREVLHVTKLKQRGPEKESPTGEPLDYQLAQIRFALEFIERVRGELHLLTKRPLSQIFAGKPTATLANLEYTLGNLDLEARLTEIKDLSNKLAEIVVKQQEVNEMLRQFLPWSELRITGQYLKGTDQVRHALISVSRQEDLLVKRRLQAIATLILQEVGRSADEKKQGQVYLEAVVHVSQAEALADVIASTGAELVELPLPVDRTAAEQVAFLESQLKELKDDYQHTLEEAKRYLKIERTLKFAYDALLHRQERQRAGDMAAHLPLTTVVSGWVPIYRLADFTEQMEHEFPAAVAEEVAAAKHDVPPTYFHNRKLVRPFEAVTDIYGKPKYTELDPSGPLALFFLVAFGLALSDAGYGLILMAITWLAERFFKLKIGMRKMVRLLFYAGASTVLFGALMGGWFGINLELLPAGEVRDLLLLVKVIDPIEQLLTLLIIVFAVGVVQLLFAWVVRGYDHWRNRDYVAVVFDDAAWISMVIVLLLWVGATRGALPAAWEGRLLTALLINTAVLVLTQGRSYKNPLLKLGTGVLSLYGLISFLSDTLSYSRLLALGLATGVIALVVNMIGSMVYEAVPVVGWLLAGVVLLVGHVFNLSINALGAFIHSGRLQFVEFFPKFMEGGGRPYKPLGIVSHYVDNPREFV